MTRNNKQINKNKFASVKAGGAKPRPYEASKEYCKNRKRLQSLKQAEQSPAPTERNKQLQINKKLNRVERTRNTAKWQTVESVKAGGAELRPCGAK